MLTEGAAYTPWLIREDFRYTPEPRILRPPSASAAAMIQKPFAASTARAAATSSTASSSGRSRPVLTNADTSSGWTASASCASGESGATASDDSCVKALNSAWRARHAVKVARQPKQTCDSHRRLRSAGACGFQAVQLQQKARKMLCLWQESRRRRGARDSGRAAKQNVCRGAPPRPATTVSRPQAQHTAPRHERRREAWQQPRKPGSRTWGAQPRISLAMAGRQARMARLHAPQLEQCTSAPSARRSLLCERCAAKAASTLRTCGKHTQTLRACVCSERRVYDEQQRLVDKHQLSRLDVTRRDQAYASPRYFDLRGRPHGMRRGGGPTNKRHPTVLRTYGTYDEPTQGSPRTSKQAIIYTVVGVG